MLYCTLKKVWGDDFPLQVDFEFFRPSWLFRRHEFLNTIMENKVYQKCSFVSFNKKIDYIVFKYNLNGLMKRSEQFKNLDKTFSFLHSDETVRTELHQKSQKFQKYVHFEFVLQFSIQPSTLVSYLRLSDSLYRISPNTRALNRTAFFL